MNNAINARPNRPDVRSKLPAQCMDINTGTPEIARDFIDGQIDTWATKVVRDKHIKAE